MQAQDHKTDKVVSPYNPANAVTASRFLTLPPLVWAVANGYRQYALIILIVCGVLDKADGLVAKIFDCRSQFGEVFDAVADAVCYGFGLIVVAAYGWAPPEPVALIITLGFVNSGLRFAYAKRAGRTINYKSYAMERLVAYTGYLIGIATTEFEVSYFFWLFPVVMIAILAHDGKRMLLDPL